MSYPLRIALESAAHSMLNQLPGSRSKAFSIPLMVCVGHRPCLLSRVILCRDLFFVTWAIRQVIRHASRVRRTGPLYHHGMRPAPHSGPTFRVLSWNVAGLRALLNKVRSAVSPSRCHATPSCLLLIVNFWLSWHVHCAAGSGFALEADCNGASRRHLPAGGELRHAP